MDKVYGSPAAALEDLDDGASIAVSGFGQSAGAPVSLLAALRGRSSRELCLVANGLPPGADPIVEGGRVRHLIVSFTARGGRSSVTDQLLSTGAMTFELVPQGTLVERLRAGGAGLGAIFTPTGLNTPIAEGKEVRCFDGKPYLLEPAIRVDYAFIAAHRADRLGNVEFRGANRHLAPSFAKAARVAIVEVDEIVDVGEIPAENIGLPGILVSRVVKKTVEPDQARLAPRRPADKPREYNGKLSWTRQQMAQKVAAMFPEGSYVNLGTGIPTLVSNYIQGRDITLHGENGILGYGEMVEGEQIDHDIFNASGQYVQALPGVSYFDSVTSFEMARSGKLHAVVLGAYQVDQEGNLANFSLGDARLGGIGGAMDLVAGKQQLIIMMEHRDSQGRPKLVRHVQYPKTGVNCVDVVVTDLAILRRIDGHFVIEEVADGFAFEEVQALTDMDVKIPTGA
jgi:3-oxoacid CoA-transferase